MQFSDKDLLTIVVNFGRLVDQRTTEVRFVADSALEEGGFELSVPGGNEPADCPLALAPRDVVAR
jgi:hypothetical protein